MNNIHPAFFYALPENLGVSLQAESFCDFCAFLRQIIYFCLLTSVLFSLRNLRLIFNQKRSLKRSGSPERSLPLPYWGVEGSQ